MSSFTDALDGLGNWLTDAAKRTGNTAADAGHVALWAPGLAMDLARWATPGKSEGNHYLSGSGSAAALGDLIKGDDDLTASWGLSSLFHGLNSALSGVENVAEAPIYKGLAAAAGDTLNWGDAFKVAEQRNIGETLLLAEDQGLSAVGVTPSTGWGGSGYDPNTPLRKATDVDAMHNAFGDNEKAAKMVADGTAFAIALRADPFIVASKVNTAVKTAKESQLFDAAAGGTFNEFIENANRFGNNQAQRFDNLFGKIETRPATDAAGDPFDEAFMASDGALDRWRSSAEILRGLKLDRVPRGGEIADLLDQTRHLEPAARVNARRDIVAAMYGDQGAVLRLNNEAKDIGYKFTNAIKGVGTHDFETTALDADKAADILTGTASPTNETPEFVAKVKDEVSAQPDFYNWLQGQVDPNTHLKLPMRETASGNRAVARLRGEGITRDGKSVQTGYNKFDAAASWVLMNGANIPGARFASKGLAVAGISPALRASARVSDALRGRVAYGSLSVEDDNTANVGLVVQDMLRRAGATPDRITHYLSMVSRAENPTTRAMAVQRAQNEAIRTIANATGHDAETVTSIAVGSAASRRGTAIDGQAYAASKVQDAAAPGGERGVDIVYLPDGEETLIVPVLNTQTPNKVMVLDLDRAHKWLKRDDYLRAIGNRYRAARAGENPLRREIADRGFSTALPQLSNNAKVQWLHAAYERTNSVWKASALLLRPGSYALRNTAEEGMRAWALHRTAQMVERVRSQNKSLTLSGKVKDNYAAAAKVRNEFRVEELKDRVALHEDEDFVNEVKHIRAELKSLRAKRTRLQKAAPTRDPLAAAASGGRAVQDELADVESSIRFYENHPTLLRHEVLGSEIAEIRKDIDLAAKKALNGTPEQGVRTVQIGSHTVELPEAYADDAFWDLTANGGGFDNEAADVGMRAMHTLRGIGQSPYLSVKGLTEDRPGVDDVVRNHLDTWAHILNFQVRQDPAGMVALKARAEGKDAEGIAQAVEEFLSADTAVSRAYRAKNPLRSHNTEAWAGDVGQMVEDLVPTDELAALLSVADDSGRVTTSWLRDNFKLGERPDVHLSASDAVLGSQSRAAETLTSRMFKSIDRWSLQRMSRHPMFSLYFEESQERLVAGALRRVEAEGGTHLSVDEINAISHRARIEASHKLKQTFYDNHVRSSAAHQLRFVYPFFAAHQNSMTFWGRAFIEDPSKLRQIGLTFQAPASLGIVVDENGDRVKPGEFIKSDHQVLLQMPERWGGPNPKDPDARGGRYRLSLGSFNLIMQNGSILNPGAGPIAAVPAGYIQKKYGAHNPDVSDLMKWFNPFGAPKDIAGTAYPTPVKRIGTLWNAYHAKNSQEYLDMYGILITDAQVDFAQKNDRPPNDAETRQMESEVGAKVRNMAWLRFASSLASPVQPRPVSAMQGLVDEFRRMQKNSTKPFEAEDKFLNLYGDTLMALTKSNSMNRAHLDATTGTVNSLRAHKALLDKVSPDVWQAVVGPDGKGAFSIDAFRWMQDYAVGQSGDKLIDRRGQSERLFDVAEAMGWRQYKKIDDALRNQAESQGTTIEKDPVLSAARQALIAQLKEKYPQWAETFEGGGRSEAEFEHRYIDGLRTISKDRGLLRDTNRYDVQLMGQYVQIRDAIKDQLAERKKAGGAGTITAKSNLDLAIAYASLVTNLRDQNDHFADYVFAPIIQRDPLYREEVLGGGR